jgi:hypothetical protein
MICIVQIETLKSDIAATETENTAKGEEESSEVK